ncbi:MAG: EF-hand domain-containing protein, partial [Planctomycetota bacterium]|nr:EF-hand domain-containing protein [Planctomycetota bacterium]
MRLDKNGDGKISKDELADERITRLFARADADKDDVVTADELKALETAEAETYDRRGPGGPPEGRNPGGPEGRGPGGPPRDGFGPPRDGFGPPGGMMLPPRPGEVLPPRLQDMLELSPEQRE